jgi:HSP20 family molecular chaperone IbpA
MLHWFDTPEMFGGANGTAGWASPPFWDGWLGFARHDTPDAVVYTVNVPGYRKKDIRIEVRDRQVVVRGEHTEGLLKPRARRSFVQSFTLPETLDDQDVRADLCDGVLTITVAKKPDHRARRVPILVAGKTPAALPPASPSPEQRESLWKWLGARFRRGS